jgi:hypothetical protein
VRFTPPEDAVFLSASQISTFMDCQRKWAFKYIEKLEAPQHPSAALGQEVHERQLGPYLLEGREFDFTRSSGEIANELRTLIPVARTPGLQVERQFMIPSPSGDFWYVGYLDLWAPDSAVVPGMTGGAPLVGDFKTTSNLAYAKTPETLKTDTQAQLYAAAMMVEEEANELDLVWFYTRTRRPYRGQRVHLRVGGSHVADQFARIDAVGRELFSTRSASPRPDDLPPSVRMCDAYGGCPYRHKCNLSPAVQAAAVNMERTVQNPDFFASLRKDVGAPPAPVPVPAGTPGSFAVHAAGPEASLQPGSYLPAVAPQPAGFNPFASHAPMPPAQAAGLPAFLTAPSDPMHARQAPAAPVMPAGFTPPSTVAINPPEGALPPAPPVGAAAAPSAAPVEAPKRGRPRKDAPAGTSTVVQNVGAGDLLDALHFPRASFAAFLREWAAAVGGAS